MSKGNTMSNLKALSLADAQAQSAKSTQRLADIARIIEKLEPGLRKWDGKNIDKRMETFLRKECGMGLEDEFIVSVGVEYSWHEVKVRRNGSYTDIVVNMNIGYTKDGKVFNFENAKKNGNVYYFGKVQEDLARRQQVVQGPLLVQMVDRYEALLRELGEVQAGLKECGVQLPT